MNPAERYILDQPEPFRAILLHIQVIIEHTVPDATLHYKYHIPFYYVKGKPFCYLNVSRKKRYVDLGLPKARALTLHTEHMITENRKKMKSLRYRQLNDIDTVVLTDVLCEAKALY